MNILSSDEPQLQEVQIAAILHNMSLHQYTENMQHVQEVIESLLNTSGLSMLGIAVSQYTLEQ